MRRYLQAKQWEAVIETNSFELVGEINEEVLEKLKTTNWLLLKSEKSGAKLPYDGIRWSSSLREKGRLEFRRQPYYRKMTVNGVPLHSIRCKSTHNEGLCKDLIHLGEHTYYHYFLTHGEFTMPPPGTVAKPRITSEQAKRVQEILENQTTSTGHILALLEGIPVSKRQCQNQARNVPSVRLCKVGPLRGRQDEFAQWMEELERKKAEAAEKDQEFS